MMWPSARMRLVICAGAMVGVFLAVTLTWARTSGPDHPDDYPPKTVLRFAESKQRGLLFSSSWSQRAGQECVERTSDGIFPPSKRAADVSYGAHRLVFRIQKARRPTSFDVRAWRHRDKESGQLTQSEMPSVAARPYETRRGRRGVKLVWRANIDSRSKDYFVRVFGTWSDAEGCARQDASWYMRLRGGSGALSTYR